MFLTPYLKNGNWKKAQEAARVDGSIFGPKIAKVESYAGYITINTEVCGSNLYFWYFPAEVKTFAVCALKITKNIVLLRTSRVENENCSSRVNKNCKKKSQVREAHA